MDRARESFEYVFNPQCVSVLKTLCDFTFELCGTLELVSMDETITANIHINAPPADESEYDSCEPNRVQRPHYRFHTHPKRVGMWQPPSVADLLAHDDDDIEFVLTPAGMYVLYNRCWLGPGFNQLQDTFEPTKAYHDKFMALVAQSQSFCEFYRWDQPILFYGNGSMLL